MHNSIDEIQVVKPLTTVTIFVNFALLFYKEMNDV